MGPRQEPPLSLGIAFVYGLLEIPRRLLRVSKKIEQSISGRESRAGFRLLKRRAHSVEKYAAVPARLVAPTRDHLLEVVERGRRLSRFCLS